jgi:hypothetical protein
VLHIEENIIIIINLEFELNSFFLLSAIFN